MKSLLCLGIRNPSVDIIVKIGASDVRYGGILKQKLHDKEQLVRLHSGLWIGHNKII